jgi:hypothetical protein
MFSPYFLRLPQIEMLVSVQYGMPGEVRPIMYSDTRESVLFSVELGHDPDSDAAPPTARRLIPPSPHIRALDNNPDRGAGHN